MDKQMILKLRLDLPRDRVAMMKRLAAEGLRLLPIFGVTDGACNCGRQDCESPGKHPLVSRWVDEATSDAKAIKAWNRDHPTMNYAVATAGITVLDFDSSAALIAFRQEVDLPPTLTVKTARGLHLYYRGETSARIGLRPKLDIKSGPSAYVVGPGSRHASGAVYALWEDEPIADLPKVIHRLIEAPSEAEGTGNAPLPVGMRNVTLTQFAGYMHARNVPQNAVLEALKALNANMAAEPLPSREVARIARSVSRYAVRPLPGVQSFADVPEEKLEWLWYPYVCLGTLGLLDGDPGDGKSQFTVWMCAQLSRGLTLPNGDAIKPANCFLFNFEDLPGAVIKKRLIANGADLDRVFIQTRRFQLTQELADWLDGEIAERDPRLVILDPIQAFMTTDTDASSNVDVREFMTRLAEIAERRRCAIICVRHFGKGAHDKAMKKGIGSTDFVGISRNQFGLARRRDDVRGFIVFHMKTNFERGDAMLFTMGEADGRRGEQPRIGFEAFTKIDPDEFFAADDKKRGPAQDERAVAKAFLQKELSAGPQTAQTLKSKAEARAISFSTLNRAREDLDVILHKEAGKSYWSLPA